jgi:uncharacterized protein YfiM (DUF2279 family)
MRRLIVVLFLILLSGAAGLSYLAFQAIEDSPLVTEQSTIANTEQARRVKNLMQRFQAGSRANKSKAELTVTEQDLESLLAFAARGVPNARADAQISERGLEAKLTIKLPANPMGRYFNLSFGLLPSEQGLLLSHVSLGGASLPPDLLLPVIGSALDALLGNGNGAKIIGTVSAVHFSSKEMTLAYAPYEGGSKELISRISENEQLRIADPERVQIYFSCLQETAKDLRGGYVSLTQYIGPVFTLAVKRGVADGGNAINENKAAILALAIYFGDDRISKLAGNSEGKYFSGPRFGSHNVTVKGRHDLVQHYLTSAGLQLAAGVDIANAIGEFKEIADTLRGGSGFSFSDIAGDRAGVVLAERAVNAATAKRLQDKLANVKSEAEFFPDIAGLPDNMTQAQFESRFGDVESQRYLDLMADIERRIAQIPLYGEN